MAAALLIGIGLTIFVEQAIGVDGPGVFFLALGLAFFLAYVNQREPSHLIVPAGALTGLGLGLTLVLTGLLPAFLHATVVAGALALGFGAICLFGEPGHQRWAAYPAVGFGVLAWLSYVTSAPWLKDTFVMLIHYLWPLLLVGAGWWVIERGRERQQI